jgi:hypothetical protein
MLNPSPQNEHSDILPIALLRIMLILKLLQQRFAENMQRHPNLSWDSIQARLETQPEKVASLLAMEESGGEPDVIASPANSTVYVFMDCSAESPAGRRSCCYDRESRLARKENRPNNSAMEMASAMGIELLDEADYRLLQTTGKYDCKTSSWLLTPANIRTLGGAIFGDYRYGQVFIYHNGVQSYYAARGFRGKLEV